jgi:glutamyl-tRNA reductase
VSGRADPNAAIVALVAHARAVTSGDREAFAAGLAALPGDERRIVVHTCHRVEVYSAGEPGDPVLRALPPGARRLDGGAAVRHLVRVACALESAVFGETEILHQVRAALEERRSGPLDPVLDRLFQVALRAGREARAHHTGPRRSLADVAVDLLPPARAGVPSPLAGSAVLVVGAGRMARLAAVESARRGARVFVANRTESRGLDLAHHVEGSIVDFEAPELEAIPGLAGIIVAVGGPWRMSGPTREALLRLRPAVIDLSSPPALDPGLAISLAERYVSVDEVAVPQLAVSERTLAALERTADRAADEFADWLVARHSVPVIAALSAHAEEHRRTELDRLRRRLPDLDDDNLAAVDQMSRRLVAAMLHEPLATLGAGGDPELEPAVRRLFRL